MWGSDEWHSFCGFSASDVKDKTLRILQGPETDPQSLKVIMEAVQRREVVTATLLNYTKHQTPFIHTVTVEPLTNSKGETAVFMVTSRNILSVQPTEHAVGQAAFETLRQKMSIH